MTQQPDSQPIDALTTWVQENADSLTRVAGWSAQRAGVIRARAALGDLRGPALDTAHPFRVAPSGPPRLVDERTTLAMAGRAQAVADARRMARIAPTLFVPQVDPS